MKILIIPDIHTYIDRAENALKKYSFDKVIFLGDYFHQFRDTVEDNLKTAVWLKNKMAELGDKAVWLFGNHDMCHAFPTNIHLMCPGFTQEKDKAIHSVLFQTDWANFKLFHYEEGFYFSHAGIHSYVFGHAVEGLSHASIQGYCNAAIEAARMKVAHPATSAGRGRGGRQHRGGIVWLDWHSEFECIDGINQVVGHSHVNIPDCKLGNNSENWNLDTCCNYIGILEDGILRTEKI